MVAHSMIIRAMRRPFELSFVTSTLLSIFRSPCTKQMVANRRQVEAGNVRAGGYEGFGRVGSLDQLTLRPAGLGAAQNGPGHCRRRLVFRIPRFCANISLTGHD